MSDNLDIKVSIKEELKSVLIFGLQARPPIAHILSFLGYIHEVMPIMQTLSHSTRAYVINTDGLKSFLVGGGLPRYL